MSKEPMRVATGAAGGCTATRVGGGRRLAGRGRAWARRRQRSGDGAEAKGLGEANLSDAAAIGARARSGGHGRGRRRGLWAVHAGSFMRNNGSVKVTRAHRTRQLIVNLIWSPPATYLRATVSALPQ